MSEHDAAITDAIPGAARARSRWALPVLCVAVLGVMAGGWLCWHVLAMAVLEREEAAGTMGVGWGEDVPVWWKERGLPGKYWPGVTLQVVRFVDAPMHPVATRAALRHLSGLERVLVGASNLPYTLELDEGRALRVLSCFRPSDPLRGLTLLDPGIDDATLTYLGRFASLEMVDVARPSNKMTGETFPRLPRLATMQMFSGHVTDAGLARMTALPALRVLRVSGNDITAGGIEKAVSAGPETLEWLHVASSTVTEAEIKAVEARIAKLRPKLRLHLQTMKRVAPDER